MVNKTEMVRKRSEEGKGIVIKRGEYRRSNIVMAITELECSMSQCNFDNKKRFDEWSRQHIPSLYEQFRNDIKGFLTAIYAAFLRDSQTQFKEWRWNLFSASDCNCLCGTLFIIIVADMLGLFPYDVKATCNSNHIWVEFIDEHHDAWFLETTSRPGRSTFLVRKTEATTMDFYANSAWFSYEEPISLLQEIFINQINLSHIQQKEEECRKQKLLLKQFSFLYRPDQMIMDVLQLRIKQLLFFNDDELGSLPPMVTISEEQIFSTIHPEMVVAPSRRPPMPQQQQQKRYENKEDEIIVLLDEMLKRIITYHQPEAYCRDLLFVIQLLALIAAEQNDIIIKMKPSIYSSKSLLKHLEDAVRAIQNRSSIPWCKSIRKQWNLIVNYFKYYPNIHPNIKF
jgi:hypothetical protein